MPQYVYVKKLVLALAMFGIVTFVAGTAKADIVVTSTVQNQGTDNVLLIKATDAATVTGTVGQNNLLVNFTSTSGLLSADPSGQAMITGGTGNEQFTNICFSLADSAEFTRAVFNINTAPVDGFITLTVTGTDVNQLSYSHTQTVKANGQNFFTVTAIEGQSISEICITAVGSVYFEDLRQVRLGGADIVPVPEPASMLLLGTGLVGVAGAARRRFRKQS